MITDPNDMAATAGQAYEPEPATDFFHELREALREDDLRSTYSAMNRAFTRLLDQSTLGTDIHLVGPFAKTDYLLREHGASASLRQAVNEARVRLHESCDGTLSEEARRENRLFDFKALCLFTALIYHVSVPAEVARLFPDNRPQRTLKAPVGEVLRVIVNQWDDTLIWATPDTPEARQVKVNYRENKFYPYDWSYLQRFLAKGRQLNLVRPRLYEDVLYPELIIVEPDLLIDISAVAACFEEYADSAVNYLINKLRPNESTVHTLLGNFAGQLLDEEVHGETLRKSYADSVRDFFHGNAISLLTAGVDSDFHTEARRQRINIHHSIGEVLPREVKDYHAGEVMLEPSFFSEMLGLQGRMDFLQLDYKVLIEQKSGKGGWPQPDPDTPVRQNRHYVQMLLYMALIRYNYRGAYERNGHSIQAFLLYSKYANSLLGLGFAPQLLFDAIRVRNGIAWGEIYYAQGGFRLLEKLSPTQLNQKHATGRLWTDYQLPQLSALLEPIHKASALERHYYLRFLTFIEREHLLSKVGNQTKENSGFAAKWHDSLDEKLAAGNIYDHLRLIAPAEGDQGKVSQVRLLFNEQADNDMSNFRVGDIVILYPYHPNQAPDARRTMVFRCTIRAITASTITLVLRAAQSDPHVFLRYGDCLWAIEHDFFESSYAALYRGMHAFLSAPQERRDLLLLQREPEWDAGATLADRRPEAYGDFSTLALRVKQASDLFLIIGPPGTGKTSFGLLYTLREQLLEPGASVLLLSFTNRAVDEICGKLADSHIDFIRIGSPLSCADRYVPHLLGNVVDSCQDLNAVRQRLLSCRVFVGTTTAMNANLSLFRLRPFSLAIIDEASQILEPHLIGLLSAVHDERPAISKFVLIGDHKQLPAVVQQTPQESRVTEPDLRDILLTDCRLSLFERLLRRYRDNPHVTYMLTRQGRMHRDIARFPNYTFYQNALHEVPLPHQIEPLPQVPAGADALTRIIATHRLVFLAAPQPQHSPSDKVNQVEADIIAALVNKIYEMNPDHFDPQLTVGVIVPYRNQIATVRNTLLTRYHLPQASEITIDTVERFQGSQRECIIYGFTIQKYYQLNFLTNNVFEEDGAIIDRKLNVAMTRARRHLLIVGNPGLLSNNITFYKLMAFARLENSYFDLTSQDLVPSHFSISAPREATFDPSLQPVSIEGLPGDFCPQLEGARNVEIDMELVGYGRKLISTVQRICVDDQPVLVDGREQARIYAHYFLRSGVAEDQQALQLLPWLGRDVHTVARTASSPGQDSASTLLIDVGCGPATGALALWGLRQGSWAGDEWLGVEPSAEMTGLGKELIRQNMGSSVPCQWRDDFPASTDTFWRERAAHPRRVVILLSHLFGSIAATTAERLASRIQEVMEAWPQHEFHVLTVYDDLEAGLNSLQVFREGMAPLLTETTVVPLTSSESSGYPFPSTRCFTEWRRR